MTLATARFDLRASTVTIYEGNPGNASERTLAGVFGLLPAQQ
jgi:hypothetical protein